MPLLRNVLFSAVGVLSCTLSLGCGEDKGSQMVKPAVPPAEAQKDSMDAYLKSHAGAASKAGKGVAPGK